MQQSGRVGGSRWNTAARNFLISPWCFVRQQNFVSCSVNPAQLSTHESFLLMPAPSIIINYWYILFRQSGKGLIYEFTLTVCDEGNYRLLVQTRQTQTSDLLLICVFSHVFWCNVRFSLSTPAVSCKSPWILTVILFLNKKARKHAPDRSLSMTFERFKIRSGCHLEWQWDTAVNGPWSPAILILNIILLLAFFSITLEEKRLLWSIKNCGSLCACGDPELDLLNAQLW